MKTTTSYLFAITVIGALCAVFSPGAQAQSIESMPAVVVRTVPRAGSENVTHSIVEIKVNFSPEMATNSWSWGYAWQDSTPEAIEEPHYEADRRTCVLKAKLEPNKTYG